MPFWYGRHLMLMRHDKARAPISTDSTSALQPSVNAILTLIRSRWALACSMRASCLFRPHTKGCPASWSVNQPLCRLFVRKHTVSYLSLLPKSPHNAKTPNIRQYKPINSNKSHIATRYAGSSDREKRNHEKTYTLNWTLYKRRKVTKHENEALSKEEIRKKTGIFGHVYFVALSEMS